MSKQVLVAVVTAVWLTLCAAAASAAVIVLDATARGWYDNTGDSNGLFASNNYIAGDCRGAICDPSDLVTAEEFRNWFRFDQTAVSETVVSARLLLDVPAVNGYASTSAASETYTLFDISAANAGSLGTDSAAIFADLGTGTSFGSHVATSADLGMTIAIDLNAAALAAINASLGSDFALGGAITTLNGVADDEYLFGFTFGTHLTRLELTTQSIPEPASLLLFAIGLAGLGALQRRRRQR